MPLHANVCRTPWTTARSLGHALDDIHVVVPLSARSNTSIYAKRGSRNAQALKRTKVSHLAHRQGHARTQLIITTKGIDWCPTCKHKTDEYGNVCTPLLCGACLLAAGPIGRFKRGIGAGAVVSSMHACSSGGAAGRGVSPPPRVRPYYGLVPCMNSYNNPCIARCLSLHAAHRAATIIASEQVLRSASASSERRVSRPDG
mgnify:CR=1 FL=1